jgi:hypothetical protein
VSQSDTIGIELRNMVAIHLNHHRDEGQIRLFIKVRAITTKYYYGGFWY